MKRKNAPKNVPQKNKKKKILNKSINLNSDSDSENNAQTKKIQNIPTPKKLKINKNNNIEHNKNTKLIGNKIKIERESDNAEINKNKKIKREEEEENMYYISKKEKEKEEKVDENIVVFPPEFTERLIEALSCPYCRGIFIRPYVINMPGCEHIFCLGCITKMLENNESGICPKCKNHFTERNIKYSEVTDHYINIFFPEIPKIVQANKLKLINFMQSEAMKYNENKSKEEKGKQLKCEIKPFKENVNEKNKMREIPDNKFMININDVQEDVVETIKSQVIKRLNMRGILKTDDIEIRMQGIEISQFKTFENLMNLPMNLDEMITFYYSKRDDD